MWRSSQHWRRRSQPSATATRSWRCRLFYELKEPDVAHQWQGVLREYADRLDMTEATPLIPAAALSHRTGADVYVKFEGMNPTGSFKDRGMTMAVSRAVEQGAKAV